jgi:hypothetical protein
LDLNIDRASGRKSWTSFEDRKLNDAVQRHGGKDWGAIAGLVPGRTHKQCYQRWHDVLDPSIVRASGHKGKWTAFEDRKLEDALQIHGDKDWGAISALVQGRTQKQCLDRWKKYVLDATIDLANGRTAKWTEDEVLKLKNAVQTHDGQNWGTIAALVPGRTKVQCYNRWKDASDWANGRTGTCQKRKASS